MTTIAEALFRIFSVFGGGTFIWKLVEEWNRSKRVPHVQVGLKNTKTIDLKNQSYISFDLCVKNPTERRMFLIFSRAIATGSVEYIKIPNPPTDSKDYIDAVSKVSTTPQPLMSTPVFRHVSDRRAWAEFSFSPLGSSYVFEPGEEFNSNYCIPVSGGTEDHIVQLELYFILCADIYPRIRIVGSGEPKKLTQLKGIDEWDIEYEGRFFSKLLRMHHAMKFQTQHNFEVLGRISTSPSVAPTSQ